MLKLLHCDFERLKKDKVFLGCMMAMLLFGILCIIKRVQNASDAPADPVFFFHNIVLFLAMSVWCALFIGTDRSDGTLRNKLIAGHSRSGIYLADLMTGLAVGLLLSLSNLVVTAALGIPLFGLRMNPFALFIMTLLGWLSMAAMVSLFTMMAELIQSKSGAAVAVLLALILLVCAAAMVKARLDAPEFLDNYSFTDSLGGSFSDSTPNPAYLTGAARAFYEAMLDALPTGQAIRLGNMEVASPLRMVLCSLIWLLGTTVAGLSIFSRRDVK